jgi:hypothetical protein
VFVDGWWMLAMIMSYYILLSGHDIQYHFSPTYIVRLGQFSSVGDHLIASGRVQPTSWLIEEQNLGAGDELTSHTDSPFLTTTDAFANRSANQGLCLIMNTESLQEGSNTFIFLSFGDGTPQCQYMLTSKE